MLRGEQIVPVGRFGHDAADLNWKNELKRTLTVRFGGVRTHIAGLDEPLRETLVRRFGRFLEDSPLSGIADFVISVRPAPVPRFVDRSGRGEMPQLESEIRGDRVLLRSHSFAGSFSLAGREAEVLLCEGSREPAHSSFEMFLGAALAWRFLSRGSLLLNAFGVVETAVEKRVHLIYSPGGISAEIASRLAAGAPVLGNGFVVIERIGGRLHAHSLPLPGVGMTQGFPEVRPQEALPVNGFHLWSSVSPASHGEGSGYADLSQAGALGDVLNPGQGERDYTASLLACAPFVSTTPRGASKAIDAIRLLTRGISMNRIGNQDFGPLWPVGSILHTLSPEVLQ